MSRPGGERQFWEIAWYPSGHFQRENFFIAVSILLSGFRFL
jgi:hypothetical protein